jgi:proteasome lid subunit RPN8/RPN11
MTIAPPVVAEVIAHAWESQPRECCGVLLGTAGHVSLAVRAHNLADSPSRFLLDPKDHIEARRTARARGLDVIGFYHSHPHSAPQPSPTDLAEAEYPGCVHLIVGFVGGVPEVRIFRYANGRAEEISNSEL